VHTNYFDHYHAGMGNRIFLFFPFFPVSLNGKKYFKKFFQKVFLKIFVKKFVHKKIFKFCKNVLKIFLTS